MKPAIDINRILKLNLFNSQDREEWMQAQETVWCNALDALRAGDIEEANAQLDTLEQLIRHPKAESFSKAVKRLANGRKQVLAFDSMSKDFDFFERIHPANINTNTEDDEQY